VLNYAQIKITHSNQERIQDFKLGGGALKIFFLGYFVKFRKFDEKRGITPTWVIGFTSKLQGM
jgi:hypothetical protein